MISVSGGICVSCYFTSDSTAEGCAIQLYNDEHTFSFNLSRQEYDELLLECFPLPVTGVFSVLVVYEIQDNVILVQQSLPDVTTNLSIQLESQQNGSSIGKALLYVMH